MRGTFTKKLREEISHHIGKKRSIDATRLSFDELEVKKDLRLKFMKCGIVYEPTQGYHLEYIFKNIEEANDKLKELLTFGIKGKLSFNEKRKDIIIYIVDVSSIMKTIKLLGAGATLKHYNRVVDEKKKICDTNRIVNFETTNIKKSANAVVKQLDDIKMLLKSYDMRSLDADLRIVIKARNKYRTASLSELAKKIGISKSALNHRFIKIRKLIGE